MNIRYFLLAALMLLAVPTLSAQAQEEGDPQAQVPLEDYFKFAAEVHVPEQGARDVIVFGPVVDINNPVEQDVLAVGSTIVIQAPVSGDVRVAGGRVIIESDIGGNVAIFAQTVEIRPGVSIAGSVRIRAEKVTHQGVIAGDADIAAREFVNEGSISGTLTHAVFVPPSQQKRSPLSWFFKIVSLFGMLVVGLVLTSVFPGSLRSSVHNSIKNPLKDFVWGLAILVGTPIVVLVLSLTIIGLPLGLLLGVGFFAALYLAKIFVGIVLGTYLLGAFRGRERAQKASLLSVMVIGVFVLWLITGIPGIGGIITFVALVWGLGILVNIKFTALKKLES